MIEEGRIALARAYISLSERLIDLSTELSLRQSQLAEATSAADQAYLNRCVMDISEQIAYTEKASDGLLTCLAKEVGSYPEASALCRIAMHEYSDRIKAIYEEEMVLA